MKKNRRIWRRIFVPMLMLACVLYGGMGFADGSARIMEVCTNESDISVYVKNAGSSPADATVQIGTAPGQEVLCQGIGDTEFETLILIDNSLSIPQNMRGRITEFLEAFFAAKAENEKVAVGVFSRDIAYLTDFTADRDVLNEAAGAVSYQNQDTYITDMLYELLKKEYAGSRRDVYRRILIIADGVDNESLGYTVEELNQLIREDTYPIYTIGCRTKNNDSELENLFALSRLSNAAYFLMDSTEDFAAAVDMLGSDKEIVKIVVTPPADLMDGSIRTVKINFPGQSVSGEMRMPQQEMAQPAETQTETEESSVRESEEQTEEETTADDEEALRRAAAQKFVVTVAALWTVIIAVFLAVVLVRHYRKKHSSELARAKNLMERREQELSQALPASGAAYIVLTDVHRPESRFEASLKSPIMVGRSSDACQIVLDYDKSVSGRHCTIYTDNGRVMVKDLHSTNGTFVNGCRILADAELTPGCTVVLGQLEMRFEYYK